MKFKYGPINKIGSAINKLKNNGISYTNTFHNHGKTNTGPGYFTLSTGVYPGKGGIISNDWYVRDMKRSVNVVEDTSATNFWRQWTDE